MNSGLVLFGILLVVGLLVFFIWGWQIIVCVVCVLYPGLRSIRALITKDENDDKEWLTYWMIFGVVQFLETFFSFILYFIPYYDYLRLIFFAWMMLPQSLGAGWIHNNVLRPFCDNHKALIRDI